MRDEKIIDDLFEAARTEQAVRSLNSVEQFVQTTVASTSSSLVLQWLKRNKMNMLISTSGVIITATILLFPKQEIAEKNVIAEVSELQEEQVELVELSETEAEPMKEVNQPQQDFQVIQEEENEVVKEKEEEVKPRENDETTIPGAKRSPKAAPTPKYYQEPNTQQSNPPKESKATEHSIVLYSAKGRAAVDEFNDYLTKNLTQLKHELISTATKSEIKKFTLKLDNRYEADFRMLVNGFEKLELHWETDADGELKDMWYRIDSKEVKKLDFSKSSKFSVRVKHKHKEF